MQCRWCDEMRCKTWTKSKTKYKNPTTEEIINHISGKGKSRSYEYGKLYPGRYNTPPLREDLVPRSRMAPEGKRKRKRKVKLSCFFDERVKPRTLRGWAIREERDCKQSVRKEERGKLLELEGCKDKNQEFNWQDRVQNHSGYNKMIEEEFGKHSGWTWKEIEHELEKMGRYLMKSTAHCLRNYWKNGIMGKKISDSTPVEKGGKTW